MGQALYRKYRSKSLAEVVGQKHITDTLMNALKNNRISHAYLFTGPRGVGKTSVARIWAHEINGLPYTENQIHLDIIEIDAASNRRIDEIRELRDKVQLAPSSAKYKVYIIDEVHMLTKEAFNALLKTLEEPPEHAVFVLATTEAHKLPETIVSRTQRFTFNAINIDDAVQHLKEIAKKEKIEIDEGSLKLIARHGDGSLRDSISILDQASNIGKIIEVADIENLIGIVSEDGIKQIVAALILGDTKTTSQLFVELTSNVGTAQQIAIQINQELRSMIASGNVLSKQMTNLMKDLIIVPSSNDPVTYLQIALFEATTSINELQNVPQKQTLINPKPEKAITDIRSDKPADTENNDTPTYDSVVTDDTLNQSDLWSKVLTEIKKHHNTLYSIARMAKVSISDHQIDLQFSFSFHQKRINETKNRQMIADTIFKITNENYAVTTSIGDKIVDVGTKPSKTKIEENSNLENISNIFGSAEVLKS